MNVVCGTAIADDNLKPIPMFFKTMSPLCPFHVAFPVHDLQTAREFYGGVLNCPEGRSAEQWIDFNLFGHQIVAHLHPNMTPAHTNSVDGHAVPVPHFGAILPLADWKRLRDRLLKANIQFEIAPYIRFEGEPGEQATMFFRDPSGNALEFKAFQDLNQLFVTDSLPTTGET